MRKVIHLNKYRYEKMVRMYAEYYHKPIDYGKTRADSATVSAKASLSKKVAKFTIQ